MEVKRVNRVRDEAELVCALERDFGEHGVYYLFVFPNSTDDNIMCTCFYLTPPDNSNMPVLVAFAVYTVLFILIAIGQYLHRRHVFQRILHFIRTDRLINADLGPPPSPRDSVDGGAGVDGDKPSVAIITPQSSQAVAAVPITKDRPNAHMQRLRSLDTFRGLCLSIMIFVNFGGGQYYFFNHSIWNGLTVADPVFPWFMFIMGTSIAIAFKKVLVEKKIPKWKVLLKICKRTVWLFCLGLMVNSINHPDWQTLRIPGVLQRFAACYFTVATIDLALTDTRDERANPRPVLPIYELLRDVLSHWLGWVIMWFCVITWVSVTFLLPVPGCPQGYVGPGGLHDNKSHPNCTGGAAGYIDRWLLSDAHIYQHPTCERTYQTAVPYDPEGVLGTLTSVFIVYLGLQAGKILVHHQRPRARIVRLLLWGVTCCLIAGALCGFSRDDGVIPVNKNLWSLSYVLCLGGMAFILLAILYYMIDVRHVWTGSPLFQPGMNSILLYVGSEVFHKILPFSWKTHNTHTNHLITDLFGTSLWVVIACYWHYINFYVSL